LLTLGIALYIIFTIYSDIYNKIEIKQTEIQFTVLKCREKYYQNKCEDTTIPALKNICYDLVLCMKKNPQTVFLGYFY